MFGLKKGISKCSANVNCDCTRCLDRLNTETLISRYNDLNYSNHESIINFNIVLINRLNNNHSQLHKEFHWLNKTYKEDKDSALMKINMLDIQDIKEVQKALTIDNVSKNSLIAKLTDKINDLEKQLNEIKNN